MRRDFNCCAEELPGASVKWADPEGHPPLELLVQSPALDIAVASTCQEKTVRFESQNIEAAVFTQVIQKVSVSEREGARSSLGTVQAVPP